MQEGPSGNSIIENMVFEYFLSCCPTSLPSSARPSKVIQDATKRIGA
jgi:hypothetical protein